MALSNADVRRARAFLQNRGFSTATISPRQFAEAAVELGRSFGETLKVIAELTLGTQGRGPAPEASKFVKGEK